MGKYLFVVGISLLLGNLSVAHTTEDKNISIAKPIIGNVKVSPRQNREDKTYSLFASPVGIGLGGIRGSMGASMYLNLSTLIGVEAIGISDFSFSIGDSDTGEYRKIGDDIIDDKGLAISFDSNLLCNRVFGK